MSDNKEPPRAWTADEVAEKIVKQAVHTAEYWSTNPNGGTMEERVSGAVFSFLSVFDGSSMDLPGIDFVPHPHADDKAYHIERGENYYDPETRVAVALQELYHPMQHAMHDKKQQRVFAACGATDQRQIFTDKVALIAEIYGQTPASQADACHNTAYGILELLDGRDHINHHAVNPTPPFMLFAAPSAEFNQTELAAGRKACDNSIPLNRKEPTYGMEDNLVNNYTETRTRAIAAAKELFGK